MKKRLKKVRSTPQWILILSVAALCALSLEGQKKKDKEDENTRTLQGVVSDADDNPAVGAVVQLKDLHTLQIRSFITKDDGAYHFSGLKTDTDYEVKAQMNGLSSRNRTLSTFDSRKAPTINLKLEKRSEPRSPENSQKNQSEEARPPKAPGPPVGPGNDTPGPKASGPKASGNDAPGPKASGNDAPGNAK